MQVFGSGWIEQKDKSKPRYRCRQWIIRFRTEDGKKSKFFVGSLNEAREYKDEMLEELLTEHSKSGTLFEDYANRWLGWRENNPDFSPNTITRDKRMVKSLNYWFGGKKLNEINPPMIKDIIVKFKTYAGNEVSGTCKNMYFSELSSILKSAVNDGLIKENPMDKVPTPKRDTKEKKCLTKREMNHFIKCLDAEEIDGRVMSAYFMIYMALRFQEVVALKWEDVDFKKRMLHIQRAYKRSNNTVGAPKSKAGNRFLPIPKPLLETLKQWHQRFKELDYDVDYICPTTHNKIMTPSALRMWFNRFLKRHKLEPITFHELRHSNLTYAARNMTPFDLQRYAGWSDLEPAKIYVHADNESMKNSIKSMF